MAKKISNIVLSIAILISGYFALTRLNYWERSIRIFKLSNSGQSFETRGMRSPEGRNFGGSMERGGFNRQEVSRGRSNRSDVRQFPDSIQANFQAGGGQLGMRNRILPDSLIHQDGGRELSGRGQFESGRRDRQGRGRDEFIGSRKLYLANVKWFLAIFASFTVIFIYADKVISFIRKKIKPRPQSYLIIERNSRLD